MEMVGYGNGGLAPTLRAVGRVGVNPPTRGRNGGCGCGGLAMVGWHPPYGAGKCALGRAGRAVDGPRSGDATVVDATLSLQNPCDPKTECDSLKIAKPGGGPAIARHLRCYSRG